MRNITKFAAAALALLIIPAAAQESKVYTSWVPKKMVAYTAPNKPITRIDAGIWIVSPPGRWDTLAGLASITRKGV